MKMIVWFRFVLCALSAAGKDFITEVGGKVNLECGGNTFANWVFWYKGNDWVNNRKYINNFHARGNANSEIAKRSSTKLTTLEISDVKETDAGEFRCVADGKTFKHTLAVVSVSVVPSGELEVCSEATFKCLVKALDQSSKVEWRKPNGSVISNETVQLKPLVISDGGTWQCHVTYKEVTFQKSLTITVKGSAPWTTAPSSSTSSGENYESACVQYETDCHPCDDVKLLGLRMHVWAALVAGGLVLVFFIIFVVIICTMVKRKKSNVLDHSEDCIFCYLDDLESMDVFEGGRSAAGSEGGRDPPPGPRVRDGPGKDELLAFISRTGMNPMCGHYICRIK